MLVVAIMTMTALNSSPARGVTISFSSTPADLSSLAMSDLVTIDVNLDGLGPTGTLELLAATVDFDATVFSLTGITPGPIIPDPFGFFGTPGPGFADGLFDAFFTSSGTDLITMNGIFFSFDLEVIGAGAGEIDLDFGEAFVDVLGFVEEPVDMGPPLEFAAPSPDGVIPEPLTATLGLIGVAGIGLSVRRRPVR
ncbi:MAG: hypothetical protein CMJ18_10115 [Phycisphaeraceae bacterium]|nr:hypothetical protein [Phycisphaeraceae bacterium]